VRRRDGARATLTAGDRIASLEFHGKVVTFPTRVMPELTFVIETPLFTARDIPGPLDEAGRMVLITTLVREGLLTLA